MSIDLIDVIVPLTYFNLLINFVFTYNICDFANMVEFATVCVYVGDKWIFAYGKNGFLHMEKDLC